MKIRYEDLLQKLDGFGTYQKRVILLVCLPQIFNGLTTLISNFILGEHKHRCQVPGVDDNTYSSNYSKIYNTTQCTYTYNATTHSCTSWLYDQSVYTDTLISTFNTVCERKFYRSHLVLAHHIGAFVGSFTGSFCSDILGRKTTFVFSGVAMFVANIVLPWAQDFYFAVFLRVLNGFSDLLMFISGFVLVTELVVPAKRMIAAYCVYGMFTTGRFLLNLMAYFLRDWHDLVLYISIPISLCLLYWFIIPESPRWLIVKGKSTQAIKILNKLARENKSEFEFDSTTIYVYDENELTYLRSLKMVIESKTLLRRLCIVAFNWVAVNLTYYGINFNVGKLGGDVYINFLVFTAVGCVGEIIVCLISSKFEREKLHMGLMLIGGVACLSTIFTSLYGGQSLHWLTITLAMIGNLTANGAFILVYLYTAELAPTVIRGFFISFCSCIGKIGSMSSSYIGDLGLLLDTKFGRALPVIIFGCVGTAAGLLCLLLPDTKNEDLPETIADAENIGRTITDTVQDEAGDVHHHVDDSNSSKKDNILDVILA